MAIEAILTMATRTTPTTVLDIIERDPDDNRVLECATAAQCEVVVTGVNDLLALGGHLRDQMRERPDLTAITRAGPVIVRGSGPLPIYARDEPRSAGAPGILVGVAQQQGSTSRDWTPWRFGWCCPTRFGHSFG